MKFWITLQLNDNQMCFSMLVTSKQVYYFKAQQKDY